MARFAKGPGRSRSGHAKPKSAKAFQRETPAPANRAQEEGRLAPVGLTSLPAHFLEREQALLGERFPAYFCWQSPQAPRGATVNLLRCTPQRFREESGLALRPSAFCAASFTVEGQGFRPSRHVWHHAGAFYSQEASAASVVPLLGVEPGMRVLDLCAAPGGKSSQLAAALQGQGLLVSNEIDARRAHVLAQNLERMGAVNAVVLNETAERLSLRFPLFFDSILLDAPCSGEGMFRKEPAAVTRHSQALVEELAATGAGLLDAAASMLRPGGRLVFSTCTFAPEEDEAQIARFLARHPNFSLAEQPHPAASCGEENRAGPNPPPSFSAKKLFRIWPKDGGEGHFAAVLQKEGVSAPPPPLAEEPGRETPALRLWHSFAQGLFPALKERRAEENAGRILLTPPAAPLGLWKGLHLVRCGVDAGEVGGGRFVPSHALFMAFGPLAQNAEHLTLSSPRTAAWLRGEEIEAKTAGAGWCAVLVDGFPLGGGKVSAGRIKNHYPKGLRNLK